MLLVLIKPQRLGLSGSVEIGNSYVFAGISFLWLSDILCLHTSCIIMKMTNPPPISPRVIHIIHNPTIPAAGGGKLNQVLAWNDPGQLAQAYIDDVRYASHGYANYEIVERIEVDAFPVLQDGFFYTPETYMTAWHARAGFHQPEGVDYHRILAAFDVIPKINQGEIDEVWLSAFPYAGYYESRMAGPEAFWCNAPLLEATEHCNRRFVIMGFSFERGVGEMLENLGHRAESILSHVYGNIPDHANHWEHFTRYDKTYPGQAEVGNVHFAPNSERDYDWGNRRKVWSRCDTWYNFPNLEGEPRWVNCDEWGQGDIRAHHLWWFRHFPHVSGKTSGISNNWWEYVVNPDKAM